MERCDKCKWLYNDRCLWVSWNDNHRKAPGPAPGGAEFSNDDLVHAFYQQIWEDKQDPDYCGGMSIKDFVSWAVDPRGTGPDAVHRLLKGQAQRCAQKFERTQAHEDTKRLREMADYAYGAEMTIYEGDEEILLRAAAALDDRAAAIEKRLNPGKRR